MKELVIKILKNINIKIINLKINNQLKIPYYLTDISKLVRIRYNNY